jgi:hypothetical protein
VITKTTTHTATVMAYADGLKVAAAEASTVDVPGSSLSQLPGFPNDGTNPDSPELPNNGTNPGTFNVTILVWGVLAGILLALIVYFFITRNKQ